MLPIQPTCKVCFEPYSVKRLPKVIIPCGHTFCESCLARLISDRQGCPLDRQVIRSSVINYEVIDPGQEIVMLQERMINQVKEHIPKDEEKSPEPQIGPTIAILEPVEPKDLSFDECARRIQALLDKATNQYPTKSSSNDYEEEAACIHRVIINRETTPQVKIRARYLQAVLFWSRNLGGANCWSYCSQEQVRNWFSELILSVHATPQDKAHARFAYAYLELNRTDFSNPDYARVKLHFERVVDDPNAKEVHRLIARFYLACFYLKELGGVEKSTDEAQRRFLSVVNKFALPNEFNNFAKLILAEFHILNERFSDAAGLLLSIKGDGKRVLAKAGYWMGCLHRDKRLQYTFRGEAKQYLRQALMFLSQSEYGSTSKLKKRLEETFKLGDRHRSYSSYEDDTRGPHYESYLSLHLDRSSWSCVIQ